MNEIEERFRKKSKERGAYPTPDSSSDDASAWQTQFDRGHAALNKALIRLVNYVAKRLVYVDLKEDFIDGLYANPNNIGACSLHSIASIIRGIIDDIFKSVRADQVLRNDSQNESVAGTGYSIAHHLLLAFFKNLLDAFEAIVVADPHAGRKFKVSDTEIILDDISVRLANFIIR
jgi:hypothetical protein